MMIRSLGSAALLASLICSGALAQTNFPEVEPNSQKSEATAVTGIVAGDTITGLSTNQFTTLGLTTNVTVDMFRVKTGSLPLGIYRHRLTLSTSTTEGHVGSIRGLNQTGTAGTASTGGTPGTTDSNIQLTSIFSTPPRFNQWYGFGKQEVIFYRVHGTAATTATYTATLSTSSVPFTVIAQSFESSSPITITTIGQATANTDIAIFDSTLSAIPGASNDDEGPAGTTIQSRLIRTLPPGTYFLAVGRSNTAWNLPAPPDEDSFSTLMDFPGSLVCSSEIPTASTDDRDFQISAANGVWNQSNQVAAPDSFSVQWFRFSTAAGAPPVVDHDDCATPIVLSPETSVVTGSLLGATNDGSASCDPGGAASRDVWFSYTNTAINSRLVSFSTCGTTGLNDTVLAVYNSCGGTEIACSDNNAACAAQPLTSLVANVLVNPSQSILVRVSDKGLGGSSHNFVLTTTVAAPPPPNDLCTNPIAIAGLGTFAVDNFGATTGPQGQAEVLCNWDGGTAVRQDIWFTWIAANSGTITLSTCNGVASGSSDTKIAVYNGVGCPVAAAIACNDDGCVALSSILSFTAVCGNPYTIQLGMYHLSGGEYAGSLFVSSAGPTCATPTTVFCVGDGSGAPCPCGNNATISGHGCATTGFPGGAILTSTGVASDETTGADTLVLTASNIPGPASFIQSNGIAFNNFGDGHLCAAVGIIRLGVVFPVGNVASYPGGLTPNEIHIQGLCAAGNLRHYQAWYRSTPSMCNPGVQNFGLTQGLSLTWGP